MRSPVWRTTRRLATRSIPAICFRVAAESKQSYRTSISRSASGDLSRSVLAVEAVVVRVKRLKVSRLFQVRIGRRHRIDRIYFSRRLTMHVGDDVVFMLLLRELNRLRDLCKEIDDRRTTELKRLLVHGRP